MSSKRPKKTKYKLKVKRSKAGLGLFTEEEIPRHCFVIEYFGPYLSDLEADRKGGRFLFGVDRDLVIDGSSRSNIARYINHSCKPNCKAFTERKRIMIYAKRKIGLGEELTYHYGKEYFNDIIKPQGCRCGNH